MVGQKGLRDSSGEEEVGMLSTSRPVVVGLRAKVCRRCGVEKAASEFGSHTFGRGWLRAYCWECDRKKAKESRERIRSEQKVFVESKRCPSCGQIKSREEYCLLRSRKDGLSTYCGDCRRVKLTEAYRKRAPRRPMVTHKVCLRCGVDKPASDFYNEPKKKDGLSYECRKCRIKQCLGWRKRNPEKAKEADRSKQARYIADGRHRIYKRRWAGRHPDYSKEYYRRNFERDRVRICVNGQRRRARLAGLPFKFGLGDEEDTMEMFGRVCAFCGSEGKQTMEHVVPVYRTDVLNPGTVRGNIIPLCGKCNDSKGTRLLEEYLYDEKLLLPKVVEHLRVRGITGKELAEEIRYFLHMLAQTGRDGDEKDN